MLVGGMPRRVSEIAVGRHIIFLRDGARAGGSAMASVATGTLDIEAGGCVAIFIFVLNELLLPALNAHLLSHEHYPVLLYQCQI